MKSWILLQQQASSRKTGYSRRHGPIVQTGLVSQQWMGKTLQVGKEMGFPSQAIKKPGSASHLAPAHGWAGQTILMAPYFFPASVYGCLIAFTELLYLLFLPGIFQPSFGCCAAHANKHIRESYIYILIF